ncbi:uncharacterized protein LOC107761024 [Nicotiana tabacum]|uniref:uncharacterized protein LOC107761024 n=1 Tax=Nicotiana tabacum TaxID=4097 RepID=UPI003F4E851F
MEQWFNKLNHTLNKKEIEEAIMICWEIWNYRNGVIWNQRTSTVDRILDKAISFINEWPNYAHGQDNEENQKWKPPDGLALKCNIDASFNLATGEARAGMVVRDRHSEFLRGRSTYIGATFSSMMAEALAVKEALSWLKLHYDDTKIELEMDSLFVKLHWIRSANQVAQALARVADSMSGSMEWNASPPSFIVDALYFDLKN